MERSAIRVLVVDDYEAWRRFVRSTLQEQPGLQIIGEVSDGLEAVQKAEELQPDLILLDVGLPQLNGIEAARRIRRVSPHSTILFVSLLASADVVRAALETGARGYVFKTDARSELLTAVNAVLRGEQFVSSRFAGHDFTGASDARGLERGRLNRVSTSLLPYNGEIAHRHQAGFYSDDRWFLDDLTQFIGTALKAGNPAIVVATQSHRDNLLQRLQAYGLDIGAAIEQGRYIALDAAATVSTFMLNDLPDPARFLELAGKLITTAAKSISREHPRVALCGECDPPLWTIGNGEAAIKLEQLWNVIAGRYDVDIHCEYPLNSFHGEQGHHIFERICAEHSAVYSR
ncbi:MAG TPA: response regulator [Terriglobales bacterium]|nr:response regulator [Terriglobales bacterium]